MTAEFAAASQESARLAAQGLYEPALRLVERCLELEPGDGDAFATSGALLLALRRPAEARERLERARLLRPERADVHNNLGSALVSTGQLQDAIACFNEALRLLPGYHDARYNLATALTNSGNHAEAVVIFQDLIALAPSSAPLHAGLGKALRNAGRLDEAIEILERATVLDPENGDAMAQYGIALEERGRIDEAVNALHQAIARSPQSAEFYQYLARTRASAMTPPEVAALEALLSNAATLTHDSYIAAHFALGQFHANAGDRKRGFEHLLAANSQKRRFITYAESETLAAFGSIESVFDQAFIAARRACSYPASWPVFIFGMPRSGTTLIEHILASHPSVYGAGELTLFEDTTKEILAGGADISPDAMVLASCDALRTTGMLYANRLRVLAPNGAQRITDKLPANFRFAGLISIALPHARMIHVQRDSIDTCVSCFTNHFAGDLAYTYDLAELGRYYRAYEQLMKHWREVLPPGAMLEVQYEDVVADLETQARRIIAYCGLEWDPRCLDFYNTDRPVKTASAAQVRQPIYKSSVGYSREYGALLDPLIEALGT